MLKKVAQSNHQTTPLQLEVPRKGFPPIHDELARIVTCLVRDSMLKDNLQEEFNKYPQPKNYKQLTKVCVNQLIWDNLSASIQSQDLRFQKYKHLL